MRRGENIKMENLKHGVKEDAVVVVCTNGRISRHRKYTHRSLVVSTVGRLVFRLLRARGRH